MCVLKNVTEEGELPPTDTGFQTVSMLYNEDYLDEEVRLSGRCMSHQLLRLPSFLNMVSVGTK